MKMELIAVLESIEDPHAVTSSVIVEAVIGSFDNMVCVFLLSRHCVGCEMTITDLNSGRCGISI